MTPPHPSSPADLDQAADRAAVVDQTALNDLLWQNAGWVELMSDAALDGTSLRSSASGALIRIAARPGGTVAECARELPKTQQAVSQVVARLERLGLIERRVGRGRGLGLHATEAGAETAERCAAIETELVGRLRELLGEERYETLCGLLVETREILREAAR